MKKFLLLSFVILITSCANKEQNMKFLMPSISGKAGDVLVVLEKDLWEGSLGNTVRSTLAAEYPFLPQREPIFTLYSTPNSAFKGAFLVHRNNIIFNIGDQFSENKVIYEKDAWASPQTIVRISAATPEDAIKVFEDNKDNIIGMLEKAERDRIIDLSKKYENIELGKLVSQKIGGSPYFPKGYSLKMSTSNFTWISNENTYVNQGVFVYTYPYTGEYDLSLASIIAKRNEILRANVPGMRANSYMTTTNDISPEMKWLEYNGKKFAEVRGLWELKGDYMGGPFISHVFIDSEKYRIVVVEGFVYAPKFYKRNYLRQVEAIIYSHENNSHFI